MPLTAQLLLPLSLSGLPALLLTVTVQAFAG